MTLELVNEAIEFLPAIARERATCRRLIFHGWELLGHGSNLQTLPGAVFRESRAGPVLGLLA
jgi:hypothetical protein